MNHFQRNAVIDLNESIKLDPPSYFGFDETVLLETQRQRIFDDLSSQYALYCIDESIQEEEMNVLVNSFERDLRFLDDEQLLYMDFNGIFSIEDFDQKYNLN